MSIFCRRFRDKAFTCFCESRQFVQMFKTYCAHSFVVKWAERVISAQFCTSKHDGCLWLQSGRKFLRVFNVFHKRRWTSQSEQRASIGL